MSRKTITWKDRALSAVAGLGIGSLFGSNGAKIGALSGFAIAPFHAGMSCSAASSKPLYARLRGGSASNGNCLNASENGMILDPLSHKPIEKHTLIRIPTAFSKRSTRQYLIVAPTSDYFCFDVRYLVKYIQANQAFVNPVTHEEFDDMQIAYFLKQLRQ